MGSNSKGSVRNSSKNFGVAGDFIPLSGTEVDKPISGDLELFTNVIIKSYDLGEDTLKQINFGDNFLELSVTDTTYSASIGLYIDGIQFTNSSPGSRGLISYIDFSANITDLDYVQKIYVDSNFVAKGVNNSTTVVLSSATLNSTYPDATTGFRVYCASIILGAMTYEKTPTGWLGFTCVVP